MCQKAGKTRDEKGANCMIGIVGDGEGEGGDEDEERTRWRTLVHEQQAQGPVWQDRLRVITTTYFCGDCIKARSLSPRLPDDLQLLPLDTASDVYRYKTSHENVHV